MKEHKVRLTYSDILMFIEDIKEEANRGGYPINTVDDLEEYMDENAARSFEISSRHPNERWNN